jgi:alanyl-tRNA synthetase
VAYPELAKQRTHIERVLKQEEERFAETLSRGMALLEGTIAGLSGTVIPGRTVFRLYDTYGFPLDLTADIARERGLSIDQAGFDVAMKKQRDESGAHSKFGVRMRSGVAIMDTTSFSGYEQVEDEGSVVALFRGDEKLEVLHAGEEGQVILDTTPFYAESGGQIGDTGTLHSASAAFEVTDTLKRNAAHVHIGKVRSGELRVGDQVEARVDKQRRDAIRLNHTATHLLHAALRKVLGAHVAQKGSLVAPGYDSILHTTRQLRQPS